MKPDYTIQIAIAGNEVAKAARDHVRALRGLIQNGQLEMTGSAEVCEMVAVGIERIERALLVFDDVVKG